MKNRTVVTIFLLGGALGCQGGGVEGSSAALVAEGTICADQPIPADVAIVGHTYGANACNPTAGYDELTRYDYVTLAADPTQGGRTEVICPDAIPAGWTVVGWDNSGQGCNDGFVTFLPAFVVENLAGEPKGATVTQCTYTYLGPQAVPTGWKQKGAAFYSDACRASNDSNTSAPNTRIIRRKH